MALTPDVIKANPTLATLSDEQLTTIATLSANDEATVINTKIGEHHGLIEKDVEEASGVKKNNGEKSYDYVKRVITDFKTKTVVPTELQTKITTQESKIADLEKKIAEGKGNEAVAQKLKDAEDKLNALNTQYETDKTTWATEKTTWAVEKSNIEVQSALKEATVSLKFKAGYPDSVQKTLVKSAKETILGQYKADFVQTGDESILVFRDQKGEIVRNKANGLNPYTAAELVSEQLKDALDTGQKQAGAGSTPPAPGKEVIDVADVSAAKTQIEADELIIKHLLQKGLVRGTAEFANEQKKIRDESKVSALPLR